MIIKVPVYVEIDGIRHPDLLQSLVGLLGDKFTKFLRKEDLETMFTLKEKQILKEVKVNEMSIKTKTQALEHLRTSK